MERPKLTHLAAAALVAAVLAGCGLSDPYQRPRSSASSTTSSKPASSTSTTSTGAADAGDPPPERNGTVPARVTDSEDRVSPEATSVTPRGAVLRYTNLYINWKPGQLIAHQRTLAQISVGAARLQAQQAAASATTDTQLEADHVSNSGQVVIAQRGVGPAAGKWVIVTAEKTVGTGDYQGLPAAIHVTYAAVTHLRTGWVVSQWSPQT